MNIYRILLELTRLHADSTMLDRVLDPLGAGVRSCDDAIGRAQKSGIAEYIDAVVDDECAVIEALLGAAFVASQAEINGVVAKAIRLHERAKAAGHVLGTTDGSKKGIRSFGSPAVAPSNCSRVQVIDSFANYFKHHDEWTGPWSKATGLSKGTIEVIVAVGAQEHSTGTLRYGAEALGIHQYDQLGVLSETVASWANGVIAGYQAELQTLNLL